MGHGHISINNSQVVSAKFHCEDQKTTEVTGWVYIQHINDLAEQSQ